MWGNWMWYTYIEFVMGDPNEKGKIIFSRVIKHRMGMPGLNVTVNYSNSFVDSFEIDSNLWEDNICTETKKFKFNYAKSKKDT